MSKHLIDPELTFYKKVDEILWKEWDPIDIFEAGEAARDEYRDYLPEVYKMVKLDSPKEEISAYLMKVEQEYMSFKGNKEKCDMIANRILQERNKFLEGSS